MGELAACQRLVLGTFGRFFTGRQGDREISGGLEIRDRSSA
jgi:hypothetical protein